MVHVYDYETGKRLEGSPSRALESASRNAGATGAVTAWRDSDGTWHYAGPNDSSPDVRVVWVE